MSISVKEIIEDAFDRTGIWPNPTDELPGEYFTLGLKILKGIVGNYNIKNYLIFSQKKILVNLTSNNTIVDDFGNLVYTINDENTQDKDILDIANISSVGLQIRTGNNVELEFIPYEIFENYSGRYCYTYRQVDAQKWELYFRPEMLGTKLCVVYNEQLKCEKNSEWMAPTEYKELFVLSLCSKLLTVYPRTSDSMKTNIDVELASLIAQIESRQYNNKLQMYNRRANYDVHTQFMTGNW